MTTAKHPTEALQFLLELEAYLQAQGDRNWIRGIAAARQSLESGNAADAKSIYKTMCAGNGSFSDYNIYHDDPDTRVRLNAPLERLRSQIWEVLVE